jgi:hypothetical protein
MSKLTSPKGFSASKCDEGNWIFSKSQDFFGIFWEKVFGRNFFGGFFWEDFFGRIFWGEFFFYVGIDLFRQDFGWFLSIFCLNGEGRRKKFRSLEVRAQAHCT